MGQVRLEIKLTEELKKCVVQACEKNGEEIGPLIERILRAHPDIEAARKKLKIEIPDRQSRGRPKNPEKPAN